MGFANMRSGNIVKRNNHRENYNNGNNCIPMWPTDI